MSTEVASGRYTHLPRQRATIRKKSPVADIENIEDIDFTVAGKKANRDELLSKSPAPNPRPISFRYNAIHDFESVFWLSLYVLVVPGLEELPDGTASQSSLFNAKQDKVFRHLFTIPHRRSDLMSPGVDVSPMFTGLRPTAGHVAYVLLQMRSSLLAAFMEAEAKMSIETPIPFDAASKLAFCLCKQVWEIVGLLRDQDVILTEGSL